MAPYPTETLDKWEDDGTMPDNLEQLAEGVIGHRIVKAERVPTDPTRRYYRSSDEMLMLTLDNGHRVTLEDTSDCCAFTALEEFWVNPEAVDHVITGVGSTNGYTTWHIYADQGDMMRLNVGWSCGNPFYYGYGFIIRVEPITKEAE